jgi:hypothetical protein
VLARRQREPGAIHGCPRCGLLTDNIILKTDICWFWRADYLPGSALIPPFAGIFSSKHRPEF